MHQRFHRGNRGPENVCDLFIGIAFDGGEPERAALPFRQLGRLGFQFRGRATTVQDRFRAGTTRDQGRGGRPIGSILGLVGRQMGHAPMRSIEFVQGKVSADSKEPGRETRLGRIALLGTMHANEGLLDQFFCRRSVSHHSLQVATQGTRPSAVEIGKRRLVAPLKREHEPDIRITDLHFASPPLRPPLRDSTVMSVKVAVTIQPRRGTREKVRRCEPD